MILQMYFLGAKNINFLGDCFVIYCDSIQFEILTSTVPCVLRISSKIKLYKCQEKVSKYRNHFARVLCSIHGIQTC